MRVFVFSIMFCMLIAIIFMAMKDIEHMRDFADKCASHGGEFVYGYKSPNLCFAPDGRRIKI